MALLLESLGSLLLEWVKSLGWRSQLDAGSCQNLEFTGTFLEPVFMGIHWDPDVTGATQGHRREPVLG